MKVYYILYSLRLYSIDICHPSDGNFHWCQGMLSWLIYLFIAVCFLLLLLMLLQLNF